MLISNARADCGISNNPLPLPLKNEPVVIWIPPLTNKLPLKVEPLTIEVTKNPLSGLTEAVTEPDLISDDTNASSVNAERGISFNPAPLPLKKPLPVEITIFPLTNKLPLNAEPIWIEVTTNPLSGVTDAVTLPLAIKVAVNAGMLNNWEPSPIKNDADTLPLTTTFPINVEPLSADLTTNPVLGETDAVTEPDLISVDINASWVKAERGILNNPSPLPLK